MAYAEIPETAERPTRGTPGEVFMNMPPRIEERHVKADESTISTIREKE